MTNYSLTQLNAFGITEDEVRSATQTLNVMDAPNCTGKERIEYVLMAHADMDRSKAAKIVTYIARSNPLCLIQQ